ncbi:Oar protein [Lysobacter dokdonensis DS-58]|uniref:Oar protein n=1 Tax=Lysobacter dokdonensis DS-58 TaxID=1300345 RepID=A0A0A2WXR9_9GAMM|nr:Oar protein [Lysobacter dokdonensis DS-58]
MKRSALTVALGLCFVGGVNAQTNTAGAIAGQAAAGDTITITNPSTGFSRTITVGADGSYRFSQLPIGTYQVSRNGGAARSATVNVGTAANVDFVQGGQARDLDTVEVVGAGAINPIDVTSVESTTILTAEQIAKIPVPRDTSSVALLAPGTVRGDAAFGNLASFGGASVAENQYYVNGFNITNSFRSLNFATVPFEAIAEQQIKTGGYGAEFGRSLGGVVNQITKRGTNEFHAGGNVFWAPESLREDVKNTYYSNPLVPGDVGKLRQDNTRDSQEEYVASVWASGALIKDKLFAYGLLSYRNQQNDTWGTHLARTNTDATIEVPSWLLKMDWNITDSHILEFTAFSDKQDTETDVYTNTAYTINQSAVGQLDRLNFVGTNFQEQGGNNYILKYTGYLTDTFTLSALAGRGEFSRGQHLRTAAGQDVRYGGVLSQPATGCPVITDARPGYRQAITGVYASSCNITGGAINAENNEDTRKQYRIDAEWQLGDHLLRFGYDVDNYTSIAGTSTEGGRTWRYTTNNGPDGLPNTGDEFDVVREQIVNQGSSNEVKQSAFYVQDAWNITDNFIAYAGLRWDTFENLDGSGNTFVKISNQFGPRLGFSWDVFGDSTFKVFGNAGRYALPLTPDVATRGASASVFTRQNWNFNGVDPTSGAPNTTTPRGGLTYINGEFGRPKNPATIASANLDPMYQDEYILGFQKALSDHFTLGVRGIFRDLKAAIDDTCDYTAIYEQAVADGLTPVIPNDGFPYCRLFNPGKDGIFVTDVENDGVLRTYVVPGSRLSPPAKRTYSAVEFFFDGNWDKFFLQGSYTYAKSKGNTEGGVKSDIGQQNTNTTQDFDYIELTQDTYGYLPNDRRHSLKLFGNYQLTDEWSVGANLIVQSGRPLNCFGVLYPYHGGYHPYGSSFMRCGTSTSGQATDASGNFVGPVSAFPRGTKGRLPWTNSIDLNVAYAPNWAEGLQFKVDVFNAFNSQKVTSVIETAEDPTTGVPVNTYLLPASFQAPRTVRFMVQYDF